ncbi:MAG: S1C family serine protease [Candidatus Moranbacteria bacterium]|nr:S1C family serine protease [Candidatus Moranbacteria bacterium]
MTLPIKKILTLGLFVAFIFLLGGFGGVFFERFVLPELASYKVLSDHPFFKKTTERTTIINKTEQVVIREDDSVDSIISQPATAVVNIVTVFDQLDSKKKTPIIGGRQVETRTGVLLTNDGLIVTYTNEKPATEGVKYSVLLFDGKNYGARFEGFDTLTNLAYFHLEDSLTVPAIAFANSDDARTGKRLVAIGNSFSEYQNRIAIGALQNKNRILNLSGQSVSSSEKWEGVFEMDLDNAKDFVGGPVIGYNGEMQGIIGLFPYNNDVVKFIIPANVVKSSYQRVVAGTLDKRVSLGVYYLPLTKAFALSQGIDRDRGALVFSPGGETGLAVLANSAGAQAGLRAGDIIIAVNKKEINLDNPLPALLSTLSKGDRAELLVIREGKEITVSVQF